ncbi:MAG TPA: GNAT family N-acetyltransferase [Dehalococcoidia bacterium]|nr:GNAT family N-acetyltransferase [Dehalococcoidia bacterium]
MNASPVVLVAVSEAEYEDFFAMLEVYDQELQAYETVPGNEVEFAIYRQTILDDMEGRELLWVMLGDDRVGFVMTRSSKDWPEGDTIMSIVEFYVVPHRRRGGVGRAAVEALLADHRDRGTFVVQASIMRENKAARDFWATLGFEVQFLQTSRRP